MAANNRCSHSHDYRQAGVGAGLIRLVCADCRAISIRPSAVRQAIRRIPPSLSAHSLLQQAS